MTSPSLTLMSAPWGVRMIRSSLKSPACLISWSVVSKPCLAFGENIIPSSCREGKLRNWLSGLPRDYKRIEARRKLQNRSHSASNSTPPHDIVQCAE